MYERKEILQLPDLELVQKVTATMVNQVVDGQRGITSAQYELLSNLHRQYKSLLGFYRHPDKISKAKKQEIKPLLDQGINSKSAYVGFELADALVATFDYLNDVDSMALKNRERIEETELDKAVKANVELADFFIKIGNRFGFTQELRDIYKTIFGNANTQREFATTGMANFPTGVHGVIEAYIFLRGRFPRGVVRAGTFEEDKCFATDIVCEPIISGEEPVRICEVKSSRKLPELKIFDLNMPSHVGELESLNQSFEPGESSRRRHSLRTIIGRAREIEANPYWIEVPSC